MMFRRSALAAVFVALPLAAQAQSTEEPPAGLLVELNTLQDVEGTCRLTFVAQNETGATIDELSLEAVIFDTSGGVVTLSLYNFRELPAGLLRARQFGLRELTCDKIGRVLINGVKSCIVDGSESTVCKGALTLSNRTDTELLG